MRISRPSLSLYLPDGRAVEATTSSGTRGSDPASNPLLEPAHILVAERAVLLEQLASTPEVRQDVMQDVTSRINLGEYLNRQTAEQTADALLAGRDATGNN